MSADAADGQHTVAVRLGYQLFQLVPPGAIMALAMWDSPVKVPTPKGASRRIESMDRRDRTVDGVLVVGTAMAS